VELFCGEGRRLMVSVVGESYKDEKPDETKNIEVIAMKPSAYTLNRKAKKV
jgi:hypothetical protein